jgi:hypothetical protein
VVEVLADQPRREDAVGREHKAEIAGPQPCVGDEQQAERDAEHRQATDVEAEPTSQHGRRRRRGVS